MFFPLVFYNFHLVLFLANTSPCAYRPGESHAVIVPQLLQSLFRQPPDEAGLCAHSPYSEVPFMTQQLEMCVVIKQIPESFPLLQ